MANIRDVARAASVSISTVSAVLNGSKNVSDERIFRVLQAVREVGYHPGESRKRMSVSKSVAVILPGTYSSFFSPLISGIEDIATDLGYDIILYDSQRNFQRETALIDMLSKRADIHSIIMDSMCSPSHEPLYLEELRSKFVRRSVNIVILEREVNDDEIHSIYVDNFKASYMMTQHLISLGHRRIAHIKGAVSFPHTEVRENGYRQAMADAGIEVRKSWVATGDFTPLGGFGTMHDLLEKGIGVDAVFASNDQMAIGAIKAIRRCGLETPRDIAVAGFDNLKFSSLTNPGITTIQYPIYQMGFQAMQMIVALDEGSPVKHKVQLATRLIARSSTNPEITDDWDLQEW